MSAWRSADRSRSRAAPPSRDDDAPLLEVEDLRTYIATKSGIVRAVDGVSFELARSATLGVVGESGSGKTILARSIMGLLPRRNIGRSGRVSFEGRDLVQLTHDQRRRLWGVEMAMVFQDPMTALNPVVTIGRQLTEGMRKNLGTSRADARTAAERLLTEVGISEAHRRLKEYPHQLSGGMRQRVTIAIALSCGPKLLFADEPTTALDVTVQAQILDLLQAQQAERRMSMILVTHDLGVVAGRTDRIAVMYAGKIVEIGPTAELFANPMMPYTAGLIASIPKLEHASHSKLPAIGGRPPDLIDPPAGCRFSPRCPQVQERCRVEEPPLVETGTTGHAYACWYPVGTPVVVTPGREVGVG